MTDSLESPLLHLTLFMRDQGKHPVRFSCVSSSTARWHLDFPSQAPVATDTSMERTWSVISRGVILQ